MRRTGLFIALICGATLFAENERDGWTYNEKQVGTYSTGYLKRNYVPLKKPTGIKASSLKSKSLEDFGQKLSPVLDQGNCGSCVIFAFATLVQDQYMIKGQNPPPISTQHYMNCSSGGQCNGAYGEEIAQDAVRLGKTGGFYPLSAYPYTARSGRCQTKDSEKFAPIASYKTLDGSAYSILEAIHGGHGVAVGIAANSSFQGYQSGMYAACNSTNINHYVVITGLNCGNAVDANGNCKFDEDGEVEGREKSEAWVKVKNSWGKGWGEDGHVRMRLYGRNGKRCNGIAGYDGDAQTLENGLPFNPVPVVQDFTVTSGSKTLKVHLKDNHYSKDALEKKLQTVVESVGVK